MDGMPAEFVLGRGGHPSLPELVAAMPFTHSLISAGKGLGYHAKAAPPTVTMPRLKVNMRAVSIIKLMESYLSEVFTVLILNEKYLPAVSALLRWLKHRTEPMCEMLYVSLESFYMPLVCVR